MPELFVEEGITPKVSVITPVYNQAPYLEASIESVLAQTWQNWELLVVDDGSTDHSDRIAQAYGNKDDRIRFIRLADNRGAAAARNAGIDSSRGRYVAFLDADDVWYPDKLDTQIGFMQENQVAFSYTRYDCIDTNDDIILQLKVPESVNYYRLLKQNVIGCSTAVYDTHYLGRVRMPDLRRRHDFALWLKLLKKTEKAYGVQQNLVAHRLHKHSMSANKLVSAYYNWQLYFHIEKLGFFPSLYFFSCYARRGLAGLWRLKTKTIQNRASV